MPWLTGQTGWFTFHRIHPWANLQGSSHNPLGYPVQRRQGERPARHDDSTRCLSGIHCLHWIRQLAATRCLVATATDCDIRRHHGWNMPLSRLLTASGFCAVPEGPVRLASSDHCPVARDYLEEGLASSEVVRLSCSSKELAPISCKIESWSSLKMHKSLICIVL